jgi:putative YhbY family RNA-binding protein
MPAIVLTASERRTLKAEAHALSPVAAIGKAGITDGLLKEVDLCLRAHQLIKVRAASEEKEERAQWLADLSERLDCAPVQSIGRIFVLWRPRPDDDGAAGANRRSTRSAKLGTSGRHRTKRSFQAS